MLSGSGKVAWWKCKNNHSYKKRIADRSGKKNGGCPYCSGRFVIKGENDLATLYPDIAKRAYESGHFMANHGYSHKYSAINLRTKPPI